MQNIPSYLRAISPFPSVSLRRYTLNTSCKNLCFPHVTTIIPWEVLETNQPAGSWECSTSCSGQCCAAVDRGCSQRMSEVWLCGIASELAHGLISIFTLLPSLRPWSEQMGMGSWDQFLIAALLPDIGPWQGPGFGRHADLAPFKVSAGISHAGSHTGVPLNPHGPGQSKGSKGSPQSLHCSVVPCHS